VVVDVEHRGGVVVEAVPEVLAPFAVRAGLRVWDVEWTVERGGLSYSSPVLVAFGGRSGDAPVRVDWVAGLPPAADLDALAVADGLLPVGGAVHRGGKRALAGGSPVGR